MTNFKGTQGKWIQNGINGVHLQSGTCIALTHSGDKKTDALLISKAPEMLEMLEGISNLNEGSDDFLNSVRKLIKEATEL